MSRGPERVIYVAVGVALFMLGCLLALTTQGLTRGLGLLLVICTPMAVQMLWRLRSQS